MEDMGNSPTDDKTCRHPDLNSQDHTQDAKVGDQYAARHNPFVYFHSIIDTPVSADAFLREWVPRILASPAYRANGLLIVTFDEAETGDDATACCNQQQFPN